MLHCGADNQFQDRISRNDNVCVFPRPLLIFILVFFSVIRLSALNWLGRDALMLAHEATWHQQDAQLGSPA